MRGEELGFGRFPGREQCPIHGAAFWERIFRQSEGCDWKEAVKAGRHRTVSSSLGQLVVCDTKP
jgi:hypothetical protein